MALLPITNADECKQSSPVVRLAFCEYSLTPLFPLVTDVQDKADWDALIAANTVRLTPLFADWVVPEAPNTMFGTAGGNDTPLGIPRTINSSVPQAITGTFQNLDAATSKSLYEFFEQKDSNGECIKYGVFLFTRNGYVQYDGSQSNIIPFYVSEMSIDPIAQTDNTNTPTQKKFTLYLRSAGDTPDRWQNDIIETKLNFVATNTANFNN